MDMLKRLDAEILVGQLSYKQCAINNEVHNYGCAQDQLPSKYVKIIEPCIEYACYNITVICVIFVRKHFTLEIFA